MSREFKLMQKLNVGFAIAAATGLLLASPVSAQSGSNDSVKTPVQVEFEQLDVVQMDGNGDGKLQWRELQPRLREAGLQADDGAWEQILGQFDEDDDKALSEKEYQAFLLKIGEMQQ